MNDVLNSIMKFINENTYLLIGICVFLILVLIGYLIDNSIKTKKVKTAIKNETPKEATKENISESVSEVSLSNNEKVNLSNNVVTSLSSTEENSSLKAENLIINDSIINTQNENIIDNTISEELNDNENAINPFADLSNNDILVNNNEVENRPLKMENLTTDNSVINVKNENIVDNTISEESITPFNNDTLVYNNEKANKIMEKNDPDENIMNRKEEVSYSNNKSLFEILSDIDKSKPIADINDKTSSENIFNEKPDIKINTDVKKEEVEIELQKNSEDELDKIMKKLSSMSEEEDNYTNIF